MSEHVNSKSVTPVARNQNQTLNQRVFIQLQQMILAGTIHLGAQMDERTLAAQLKVSRTPLREAIRQLVREGIVEYRPYRGHYLRSFTVKEVNDLFCVRSSLEALAVRLAMPKISNEITDGIRRILDRMEDALDVDDMAAYTDADQEFHRTIVDLTGNATLIAALERLGFQIQMIRTIANQDPNVVERTRRERPQILAALDARNADLAAKLMEEHIEGVRQAVVVQLQDTEFTRMEFTRKSSFNISNC